MTQQFKVLKKSKRKWRRAEREFGKKNWSVFIKYFKKKFIKMYTELAQIYIQGYEFVAETPLYKNAKTTL